MTINKTKEGGKYTIALDGRLDTTTAPELEKELDLDDTQELLFDFTDLQYLSSAGLRVLLAAQKKMNAKDGKMVVRHVNDMIMDVFDATGFVDILTIENE